MASKELKQEIHRVGIIHDFLQMGTFPGHTSQELLISQLYMQKLHKELKTRERAEEEALAEQMAPSFTEQVKEAAKAV